MRFPNLVFAIERLELRHFEVADRVGMERSRFSRCVRGRFEFTSEERRKLAKLLGYSDAFLFAVPPPPRHSRTHAVLATAGANAD